MIGRAHFCHLVMYYWKTYSYECQEVDFQSVDGGQNGKKGGSGLVDVRRDLPKAVQSMFAGTASQRKAAIQRLYAEVSEGTSSAVFWMR